jgi:hypothetical protein
LETLAAAERDRLLQAAEQRGYSRQIALSNLWPNVTAQLAKELRLTYQNLPVPYE